MLLSTNRELSLLATRDDLRACHFGNVNYPAQRFDQSARVGLSRCGSPWFSTENRHSTFQGFWYWNQSRSTLFGQMSHLFLEAQSLDAALWWQGSAACGFTTSRNLMEVRCPSRACKVSTNMVAFICTRTPRLSLPRVVVLVVSV